MQLPFGLQVFWPRDSGEWAAWATLVLVLINAAYVYESRRTLNELRLARFVEVLPVLRWQQPEAFTDSAAGRIAGFVNLLLTNEGPGPARILDAQMESDRASEQWKPLRLSLPSTMASRVRLEPFRTASPSISVGTTTIKIRIRYGDLLGEFEYETRITLAVDFRVQELDEWGQPSGAGSTAEFIDSDERSALERRVPRRPVSRRSS